ncbi:MAG: hypothetical protein U5K51_12875 [Flavobacteriaceae bacterium]|nr:hypothetical protein [Flavobacteriaceae bacterium]
MKKYISLFLILLIFPFFATAQEDVKTDEETKEAVTEEDRNKLERPAFESSFIVDNPTDVGGIRRKHWKHNYTTGSGL